MEGCQIRYVTNPNCLDQGANLFLSEDQTQCLNPPHTDVNGNPLPTSLPPQCGSGETKEMIDGKLMCVGYDTVPLTNKEVDRWSSLVNDTDLTLHEIENKKVWAERDSNP